MNWQFISARVVAHVDGHKIELKSGSWKEPLDIHPAIKRGTPAVEVARIIREGLAFAEAAQRASKRVDFA